MDAIILSVRHVIMVVESNSIFVVELNIRASVHVVNVDFDSVLQTN